jgi:hypothetical protein
MVTSTGISTIHAQHWHLIKILRHDKNQYHLPKFKGKKQVRDKT